MQVEKLEIKAGAIIKLFKDFATHTQSSKQGDKPEKFTPTLKRTSLQSGCQGLQSCPNSQCPSVRPEQRSGSALKGGIPFPYEHKSSRIHA